MSGRLMPKPHHNKLSTALEMTFSPINRLLAHLRQQLVCFAEVLITKPQSTVGAQG